MEDFDTTNPVEGDALPATEVQNNEGASTEDLEDGISPDSEPTADELDEEAPDQDDPEDERFEEIERNGKKATIPAWLKPELMIQADYTRKTQELAEARRTFESEREAVQQLSHAELSAHANLNAINSRIDQLTKVDWQAWNDSDPIAAQQAFGRFQL